MQSDRQTIWLAHSCLAGSALDYPSAGNDERKCRRSRPENQEPSHHQLRAMMNERMVDGRINRESEIYNCSLIGPDMVIKCVSFDEWSPA